MLDIIDRSTPIIRLTPRAGFRTRAKALELELVYGHKCPFCGNVITACFRTNKSIDILPYEETTILSQGEGNKGEVLKIVPNKKDPDSCYHSQFFGSGGDCGQQRLLMKNHILRVSAIERRFLNEGDGNNVWEPGERPCIYAGIFSEREDLLVKDLMLVFRYHPMDLKGYNIPKVSELIPNSKGDENTGQFRWIPAIGNAPPVVYTERNYIKDGSSWYLNEMLRPFRKA